MTVESIHRVAVIGAGTMGQGIAQACAMAGYDVIVYDVAAMLLAKAMTSIEQNLSLAVEKNKLSPIQKETILEKISTTEYITQLQADIIIEAVVERLDVKKKIFADLEKANDAGCILTSNTSSLSITQIASAVQHQERVAGLHFFNPAHVMKLVEIVHHDKTSAEVITTLQQFVAKLNKVAVVVKDSPGFIVNRVARQYYLEALRLAEDGIADFKTIDALLRSSGFKMGPFELMDLIGMDINYSVTKSLYEAFDEAPRFKPSQLQKSKVDAGELGRKTKKGFYEY